jgi:hypothetical protein
MILKPAKYFQKSYRCNIKGAGCTLQGVVVSAISVDDGETICKIQVDEATSRTISKLESQVLAFFTDNQEALMVTTKKRYDIMASFQSCTHVDHILKLRVIGEVDMASLINNEVSLKLNLKTLVIYKNHSYVTFIIDNLEPVEVTPPAPSAELIAAATAKLTAQLAELAAKGQEIEKEISKVRAQLEAVPEMDIDTLTSLVDRGI